MLDVAFTAVDGDNLRCVDIQTDDVCTAAGELDRKRQAHVSQPDDTNFHGCQRHSAPELNEPRHNCDGLISNPWTDHSGSAFFTGPARIEQKRRIERSRSSINLTRLCFDRCVQEHPDRLTQTAKSSFVKGHKI